MVNYGHYSIDNAHNRLIAQVYSKLNKFQINVFYLCESVANCFL